MRIGGWRERIFSGEFDRAAFILYFLGAVVERGEQILAVALEIHRRAPRERAAQPRRRRDEEVAGSRRAHAADPAAHEMGRDPASGHFDFGKLGHGISGGPPGAHANTRAFRYSAGRDPPISEDLAVSVA